MDKIVAIAITVLFACSSLVTAGLSEKDYFISSADDKLDMVVIAPEFFSDALRQLIEYKNSVGINTLLKTTEEIYSEYNGRDDSEQLKYFIKEAYDEMNISYVLLIGGRKPGFVEEWFVPVRYATFKTMGYQNSYISDLYFSDIYDDEGVFQTWDRNNDDLFGTLRDNPDCHPDICVGRWPCRTTVELQTMIEKTIAYETSQIKHKRFISVGGDTFIDDEHYNEGEMITNASASCLQDFEVVNVFSSETIVSADTIQTALGDGAMFMHFKGHGWVTYWNTYVNDKVWEESEPGFGIWNIPHFSNSEYPIVLFGGCNTAMCNVSVFHHPFTWLEDSDLPIFCKYFPAFESITWAFTRKPDGGSVAGIGYTGMAGGWYGENGDLDNDGIEEPDCVECGSGFLEIGFFEAIGKNHSSHLGPCMNYALEKYILVHEIDINTISNIQKFILFGDPSLKIGGYPN